MKRYLKLGAFTLAVLGLGLLIGSGTVGELLRFGDEAISGSADKAEAEQIKQEGLVRGSQSGSRIDRTDDVMSPAEVETGRLTSAIQRSNRDTKRRATESGSPLSENESLALVTAWSRAAGGARLTNDILLDASFIENYIDQFSYDFERYISGGKYGALSEQNKKIAIDVFLSRNPDDGYQSYVEYVEDREWEVK